MSTFITDALAERRNGAALPMVVRAILEEYLTSYVLVEKAEELPDDAESWYETALEAWAKGRGGQMPYFVQKSVAKWAGVVDHASHPAQTSPPSPVEKSSEEGVGAGSTGKVASGMDDDPLLEGISVSGSDKEKALEDFRNQGLSGVRVLALCAGLQLGTVFPIAEVSTSSLVYGGNPMLMDQVKMSRKAGVDTLGEIIKSKDKMKLTTHLNGLLREYNQKKNCTQEVAILSQWKDETLAHFEGNSDFLWLYLAEYLKKYAGRGLPTIFDTSIAWRVTMNSSAKGAESEELKAAKKEAAAAKEAAAQNARELKEAMGSFKSLRNELQQLRNSVKTPQPPGGKGKGGGRGGASNSNVCWHCGEEGHQAKDCPNKDEGAEK